jgi:hypothetical protein
MEGPKKKGGVANMATNKRGQVPEEERCKGMSRQTKERCKRRRSPGSDYCIFHGGRVPKGGAHPGFKHGKRSRYMPSGLFEHFDRFVNDPKIAHHRKSIAQIDAMVEEAWENYEVGGTPQLWRKLKSAWRKVEKARAGHDTVGFRETLDEVGGLIGRGADQIQRMDRIVKLLDQRRKHADSELKRRQAEERTFTHEEAAAFYKGLGEAVRKHIKDHKARKAIMNDIAAIAGKADVDVPSAPEAKPRPEQEG